MVDRHSPVPHIGAVLALSCFVVLAFSSVHARGAVFGRDTAAKVHSVEDSSEALCLWHGAGVKNLPLVSLRSEPGFFSDSVQFEDDPPRLRKALANSSCNKAALLTQYVDHEAKLFGTGDFIFAAFRLGIVRELWWVVPVREGLKRESTEAVKKLLRTSHGLPEEFVEGLVYEGESIRGSFRGLPVRILSLGDLPVIDGPVLLSVDTEWLVNLYENPVKESMLDLVGGFFKTLQQKKLKGDLAVVARSVERGSTPLRFGYLADYVRLLLARPAQFAEGPPPSWRMQNRVEYLDFMLARDEALAVARRLAESVPDSPVPWYDMAYISAVRGDAQWVGEYLGEAAGRDGAYAYGYIPIFEILAGKFTPAEGLSLLEEGHRLWPEHLDLARLLGKTYLREGRYGEADDLYAGLLRRFPGVADLHADYAAVLWAKGEKGRAVERMQTYRKMVHPGLNREETLLGWEAVTKMPVPRADTGGEQ